MRLKKIKEGLRKCKYEDNKCRFSDGKGYCLDEDYEVSGFCPFNEEHFGEKGGGYGEDERD